MSRKIFLILLTLSLILSGTVLTAGEADSYYQFLRSIYDKHDAKLNDFLKAELDYFVKRYSSDGDVGAATFLLGKIYLEDNHREAALAIFIKILFVHYESGEYALAVDEIKRLLAAHKEFKDCESRIVDYISNGIRESSISDRYYRYLEFIYNLGREKMYDWALGQFYQFLTVFRDYPQADRVHRWIAGMYAVIGNYPAAMEAYNKYETLYPQSVHIPLVKIRKAKIMADNLKEFDSALTICSAVIDAAPGGEPLAEALILRAEIKTRKLRDYTGAITDYRRIVDENLSHEKGLLALFAIADVNEKKMKAFIAAIGNYEEIAEIYADHFRAPEALVNAARLHLRINEPGEAVKKYDALARLYPKSSLAPEALFDAGSMCDSKLRDYVQAQFYYNKLISQYPQSEYAGKAQKKLGKLSNKKGD